MAIDASIHAKAVELTKLSIQMTTAAGSGHPSTAASLSHLITCLMYQHMRYEPANPKHPGSDRLVLSEGHAVPIVYAACADLGVAIGKGKLHPMTRDDAMTLREVGSVVDGHPNPLEGFPFFDSATGSLGQGLSTAAGLAQAAQLDGIAKRIFCIIGDGESREGQVAEALDYIMDAKLTAVLPIFNCNVYAQSDKASPQQQADTMVAKLKAFGYDVRDINGHDPNAILAALAEHAARADAGPGQPIAIVARTTKGWGAASMQGNGHHGTPIKPNEVDHIFAELDATAAHVGAAWTDGDLAIAPITAKVPDAPAVTPAPSFTEALIKFGKADALAKGKFSTRRAYGVAVRAAGHANPRIVALDADVRGSTYADDFAKDADLAARFFDCRIAEQNMVSVAAGFSAGGKIPFISTFAKFLTRAYDQIEMSINSGANLKLIGSHAGVSLGADGPSQMALPDVAWFRSFTSVKLPDGRPAMYVLQPSDAFATYALVQAMAAHDGPCYMRTLRPDTELLYDDKTEFTLGGHEVIAEGNDLLIVASGYMVHEANRALDGLEEAGISATLVDLYSLPFDEEALLDLAQENNGMVLTVEDNYGAGVGGAVASALAEDGGSFTLKQMTVERVPKSGKTPDDLLKLLRLSADDIVRTARELMELASP
ncbi:MAG: transketolase [Planctomycetes bacterium]|nr:transketolase [Planctomycetota bacterium]